VKPHIIERVQTPSGNVVRAYDAPERTRLLHPETVSAVEQMLVSVVESGTGQLAGVKGLTVAGKTGTAQKIEPTGRYSHSRYVASFVGYGPVSDSRRYVICVNIDEPRTFHFGGVVAAPIFKRVMERLSSYWGAPPQLSSPQLAKWQ